MEREHVGFKSKDGAWKNYRKKEKWLKGKDKGKVDNEKKNFVSVLFAPHTEFSQLAKRWRAKLEELEKVSNLKLKMVERTGEKLTDLLHKSNAWDDNYCKREDCIICNSTSNESRKGLCKKRNVIYETYCVTCHKNEKYESEKVNLKRW